MSDNVCQKGYAENCFAMVMLLRFEYCVLKIKVLPNFSSLKTRLDLQLQINRKSCQSQIIQSLCYSNRVIKFDNHIQE